MGKEALAYIKVLSIKRLFLGGLFLGAVVIFIGNIFGNMLITVLLPTLVMFAYIYLGQKCDETSYVLAQFSDSIYYMGFLFTLTALVASLLTFSDKTIDINSLVSNFGLALTTTIVGLGARIYFSNFSIEESGIKERVKNELKDTSRILISECRNTSNSMRAMNVSIQDTIDNSIQACNKNVELSSALLEESTQLTKDSIVQNLSKLHTAVEDSMLVLSKKISNIDISEDILVGKIVKPVEMFNLKIGETSEVLEEINEQQKKMRDSSRKISNSLETTSTKVGALNIALDEFNSNLNNDHEYRKKSLVETAQIFDNIGPVVQGIETSVGSIVSASNDFEDVRISINSITESIKDYKVEIEGNTKTLNSSNENIKSINLQYKNNLSEIEQHQKELNKILEESRESLKIVSKQLVDSVNYIEKRLSD